MTRTILRRAALATLAGATAMVLAACGSDSGGHGDMSGMGGSSATPPAAGQSANGAFNDADVNFAQMMIPHHQQAVEMTELAATRATDPEVKTLAAAIKNAQGPEITQLTGLLTEWGKPTTLPPGDHGMGHGSTMPGMMSDADMAKLKAASGKEFDKQFCTMMIAHHEGAIQMAKDEVAKGSHAKAKELAQAIATTQQGEIETMKKILARL
ncbi:hypothetical protein Val02_65080 [Virgisporangium aliadipatigenens]|uniref:DUF305 domain-containing protein n=1 Tax=Virgisporangium aliadipatigenens TaxID=741659 RepID=A0A8J3YS35_9ACTN|nr:DUF305 domain-containing protein [Virgisporangium aliadipatigenens]GIJ49622.1 hypothetical protein Val02_65080 [Virgisporangium aliadipatigenens]